MADWAYNPVHGWSEGPYNSINCEYPYLSGPSSSYLDPFAFNQAVNGFFPAPAGYQWVDLTGGGMPGMMGGCGCGGGGCGGGCGGMGGMGGLGMMGGMFPPMMSGGLGGGMMPPIPSGQTWQQFGGVDDQGTPGINVKNSSGGIGLEPGYNYIFPDEHVKVHVLKTSCPPWQLEGTEQIEYQAHMVPTCVTIGTMMAQFGCDNKEKKKNVLYEVTQGGNGKWYRGISIKGDDDKKTEKRVGDMGWSTDELTWLYFTKD